MLPYVAVVKYVVIALLSLGCGRIGFDGLGDRCPGVSCDLGPWLGVGGSHSTPSTTRVHWASATGGGVSSSPYNTNLVAMTTAYGRPVVVYVESAPSGYRVHARRFDGASNWPALAPPLEVNALSPSTISATIGASNQLWVAWKNRDTNGLYVAYFDGTVWGPLANSLSATGIHALSATADTVQVQQGPSGEPIVAWINDSSVFALRFDGNAWTEMGSGSASGNGLSGPTSSALALSLSGGDTPHIAWTDGRIGDASVFVLTWSGSQWVALAGSNVAPGISGAQVARKRDGLWITQDSTGNPAVAWVGWDGSADQVYLRNWDGTAWREHGSSGSGPGLSMTTSQLASPYVEALSNGGLFVTWQEHHTRDTFNGQWLLRGAIRGRLLVGSTWVDVAGSASESGLSESRRTARHPIVSGSDAGSLCVAWDNADIANTNVFMRCHDGSAWAELGTKSVPPTSISATTWPSHTPNITVNQDSRLEAAWIAYLGEGRLYSRTFNGTRWAARTSSAASGSGLSAVRTNNPLLVGTNPYLFWRSDSECLLGRVWDGQDWSEVSPESTNHDACGVLPSIGGDIRDPAGTVDHAGHPILAFQDHCDDWNIYLVRWNGAEWRYVGGEVCTTRGASDADHADSPSIAMDPEGRLWLAYVVDSSAIEVRRINDSGSELIGGTVTGPSAIAPLDPVISLDAQGTAWIAWSDERDGIHHVFAARNSGGAWHGVAGSTSNGISHTTRGGTSPQLVIDGHGQPIVAWLAHTDETTEVYARRYNGAQWQELSGSASGGGISNSDAPATSLALNLTANQLCVTWAEPITATSQVVARCIDLEP